MLAHKSSKSGKTRTKYLFIYTDDETNCANKERLHPTHVVVVVVVVIVTLVSPINIFEIFLLCLPCAPLFKRAEIKTGSHVILKKFKTRLLKKSKNKSYFLLCRKRKPLSVHLNTENI